MAVLIVKPPAVQGASIIEPLALTVVVFDATMSEDHTSSVEWTDFPVESGLDVTDHAIENPNEVVITGVISDTPLFATPTPNRSRSAFETLIRLKESHKLVTVVTGLKVYNNMGIVSVTTTRDNQTGQAVVPVVEFKQIRLVQSVTIPIPPELLKPSVAPGGSSESDAGAQSPSDVDVDSVDPNAEAYQSLLVRGGVADMLGLPQ
jgi:hypothetical protein